MQSSLLILLALVSITAACPGLFGMGGGGGCGCGAPPPPSPCGCGGRKKRSLPDKPTAPEFFGIAAGDKDVMCNTPELKKIILENMHSTSVDSSKAINTVLESRQLNRFVVVCSENPFVFTIRADTAYCGATKNGHNCHAFAM
ncbi:hypothetical protein GCK72_020047 [Caenorhabditis remanei]|uniref:Ground-like domain-containing protein n=1 Tax=Caenorhabditis remanei TaxID=31234 RepID=A0A6A5GEG3_CAERE|nr:hypothetical protein GCK72_020047 [Caenorhabditis remanei]KAF1753490.1 hypothetical protein GCK72_020047 [Caenorhabditis remanei]